MFYSVLTKSDYRGDRWKLYATYDNNDDAKFVASSIQSPRRNYRYKYTMVVSHASSTYPPRED